MINNPHDALFKAVFGQPEHARGTLRAVVPAPLAEALNWSTLTPCPGSFIDEALIPQHTDLLYSTTWRDGDEALVYFLFEHQSNPPTEGLMAYRLLRYKTRIWASWQGEHPRTRTLPMIIPIVMYHGATPWLEARSFDALLRVPADLRAVVEPYLVRFHYLLNDLSQIPDDELRKGAMRTALARLVGMCFKHARSRDDFIDILARWMDVVREVVSAPNGLDALAQVMRYILEVNKNVGTDELKDLLVHEVGPEAGETVVTTGQQLIEQGRQQGLQQGLEQGRQQELEQAHQRLQRVLLSLLRRRFEALVDAHVEQRVAAASIDQLEAWSLRVLSATTLADVFAD